MKNNPLTDQTIILGITGSIAAYKAADLASKLSQQGAQVETVFTPAAGKFITPLTFQSVTGQRAYTDSDLWGDEAHVLHIGLAHQADLLLIAPATANTIAKLAQGSADDLLSLTALAFDGPLLIAPAMDAGMFSHPATQANLQTLEQRGALFIGPEEGHLASGLVAKGRMTEPATILEHVRYHFSRGGPLQGNKIIVTAGGTQEPLDPVRYLGNRSSGKQGFALARAALDAGADVELISAPSQQKPPIGAEFTQIQTAEQMKNAVLDACQQADALLMAAAVADFKPARQREHKVKRSQGTPNFQLQPTVDILEAIRQERHQNGHPRLVVGFAAESDNLVANAQEKLGNKDLDMIAANDISAADAGFDVDTNRVTLLYKDGEIEELPLMSKVDVAAEIIERITPLLAKGD
jgi:phosphopantothenoylcysteine decarboxylase/phosphopantothenate--cysteine ligase